MLHAPQIQNVMPLYRMMKSYAHTHTSGISHSLGFELLTDCGLVTLTTI